MSPQGSGLAISKSQSKAIMRIGNIGDRCLDKGKERVSEKLVRAACGSLEL